MKISAMAEPTARDAIALHPKASQTIPFLGREITMPKVSLSRMTVEALMDLRKRVDDTLHRRRAELENQLEMFGGRRGVVRGGGSPLRGKKVPPRYRSPSGETWAGRGAKPRWLVAAVKSGKKLDDFLIDKSTGKGRRKRRSQSSPVC
jgi:DNA-binding protein H-NS